MTAYALLLNGEATYYQMLHSVSIHNPAFTFKYLNSIDEKFGVGWIQSKEHICDFLINMLTFKTEIENYNLPASCVVLHPETTVNNPRLKKKKDITHSTRGEFTVCIYENQYWAFPNATQAIAFYEYFVNEITNLNWKTNCRRDHPDVKYIIKFDSDHDWCEPLDFIRSDEDLVTLIKLEYAQFKNTGISGKEFKVNVEELTFWNGQGTFHFECLDHLQKYLSIVKSFMGMDDPVDKL